MAYGEKLGTICGFPVIEGSSNWPKDEIRFDGPILDVCNARVKVPCNERSAFDSLGMPMGSVFDQELLMCLRPIGHAGDHRSSSSDGREFSWSKFTVKK
jgi:hypothetical protein